MSKEYYESAATTKAKIGNDIVTQTLDTLNSSKYSGKSKKGKSGSTQEAMSNSYQFNKDVLSAAYSDKGSIFGTES